MSVLPVPSHKPIRYYSGYFADLFEPQSPQETHANKGHQKRSKMFRRRGEFSIVWRNFTGHQSIHTIDTSILLAYVRKVGWLK